MCDNKKYDGAFYLAGYSVELSFKAIICEKLGIPNLFDTEDMSTNNTNAVSEIRKVFKTHNLYYLLMIGGFKIQFDTEKAENKAFFDVSSLLFNHWNETCRYKPCGYMKDKEEDVEKLIELLRADNGLLQWIEKN